MFAKQMKVISIILISMIIVGCGDVTGQSPKEVVTSFIEAKMDGRYEESYKYISSQDKSFQSFEEYKNTNKINPYVMNAPIGKVYLGYISFNILSVQETGDTANVKVEMNIPDPKVLLKMAFSGELANASEKEAAEMVAKKIEDKEFSILTKNRTFNLVKEKDGWKIFLDIKGQREKREKMFQDYLKTINQ